MRRAAAAIAALAVGWIAGGCSRDSSTPAVRVASGTVNGAGWSLAAFRNGAGELCLEIRDGAMTAQPAYGGGCGGWHPSAGHDEDPYVDGPGPAGTEFAFGPLRSPVATVEASAPGQTTVVARAQPMPAGLGAPKAFVLPLPDGTTTWTYTGRSAAGAPERLGL